MNRFNWHFNKSGPPPALQQPQYDDLLALEAIKEKLANSQSIINYNEVDQLFDSLQDVVNENAIIIQGGDCVETFDNINQENISNYAQLINNFANLLKPFTKTILIGRVAGQFAKPRSYHTETRNSLSLPIYRGDMVNSINFTQQDRKPNPNRLLISYHHAVQAIKYLKNVELTTQKNHFISHEALILNYEQCFTRKCHNNYYNLSAHFLWIGKRTCSLNNPAHIEYISSIVNPVGIKIDHHITPETLLVLINIINPSNIPGKLILIFRLGANNIQKCLPQLLQTIKKNNKSVILMCDPMHGNTIIQSGEKTRNINTILLELSYFMDILKLENMYFGGIHLEMTHQDITECTEDFEQIGKYSSYCDPRLNTKQSLKIAQFIAERLQ